MQYAALIIDSAQLLGSTIGKICQNYVICVSYVFHIPTCTAYFVTKLQIYTYVQKMGRALSLASDS